MKTITPHTPSPWYVTEYAILAHNGGTHILEHPKLKWEKLASITGSRGNIVSKMISECEANARLIAAAPELLDALQSCVSELNQLAFLSGDKLAGPAIQKGLDAIAKAEGRTK